MANRIYQIPIPGQWPDGHPFDPINDRNAKQKLDQNIQQWKQANPAERTGYELESIDQDNHLITLSRRNTIAGIQKKGDRKLIRLPDAMCNPGKGKLVCATFEPQNDGWYVTEFNPYQGEAYMERLDQQQLTCRAILAKALKLDPWDLKVTHTPEGGWHVTLAPGIIYSTDQDNALNQAVTTNGVGHPGWYANPDPATNTIIIHPGQLPTFQPTYPYPWNRLGQKNGLLHATFAVKLPDHGGQTATPLELNWKESSFLLVGGEGGTGKSVAINDLIANEISQGVNLAIIDTPNKAGDYYWLRPWVTPGYWGCDSDIQAAGVINRLIHDIEHGERAQAWKENGWQSWYDIPQWAKDKYPIFVILIDEYSTLVDGAMPVRSMPNPDKTLPPICEQTYHGYAKQTIKQNVTRLLRTARAQGYRLILISQTISERSGLGPTIRDLFGHRIVMGPNPSKSLVEGTFHDPANMPDVPANLYDDKVTKGVGRSELAGDRARIFKTYWAGEHGLTDTQTFGRKLMELRGLPDGIDPDRYLDTLRAHTGDDPIDVDIMNQLTARITITEQQALQTDSILASLKDVWDQSLMNFGTTPTPTTPPAASHEGPQDTTPPRPGNPQTMPITSLARIMSIG